MSVYQNDDNISVSTVFNRLSSFIIHDLKNVTDSLSLISQNAKYNMANPEFQQDTLETIAHTVSRMTALIDKLSCVPRYLELKKKKVYLKYIVEEAVNKMLLVELKNVIVTNETKWIPYINVDPDAMEMIFLNLLLNAYDAIQGKGVIRVRARTSFSKEYVDVTISDNGIGMSKEFIAKYLFKPFKTTKNDGFGIGLYQCKVIIDAHGGEIIAESEEGKGTIFTLRLPLYTPSKKTETKSLSI